MTHRASLTSIHSFSSLHSLLLLFLSAQAVSGSSMLIEFSTLKGTIMPISFTFWEGLKDGTGMAASPSPFLTPRPEKRRGTLDWNSNHKDKDKEVNVQVVLRCRVYHMKCFRISKQPLLLPHQLILNSYFCKNQGINVGDV